MLEKVSTSKLLRVILILLVTKSICPFEIVKRKERNFFLFFPD
jgi:hypothetical protein